MPIYGIAINALTRRHYTGTERYSFELIRELMRVPLYRDEKVVLYTNKKIEKLSDLPFGWSYRILPWRAKGWTHVRLSFELLVRPPDVFFSPAHEIPFLHRKAKIVNTVHDIAFLRLKDSYSWWQRMRQHISLRRTIWRADGIITVSEATKTDLTDVYPMIAPKIISTPLAVRKTDFQVSSQDCDVVLPAYGLKKGEYFIVIGRIEEKKNSALVLDAFAEFKRKTQSKMKLLFVGNFGSQSSVIKQKLVNSPVLTDILTPGYVPDSDKAVLLSGAFALIFASKYEGFGIPILEALTLGVPILASDIPSSREVAGKAAIFLSGNDIQAWANCLEKILFDEKSRTHLASVGKQQAEHFSWPRTARKTMQVLRDVCRI